MKLRKFEEFKMNEGLGTIILAGFFFGAFLRGLIEDIKRRRLNKKVKLPTMDDDKLFKSLIDVIEEIRNAGIDVYKNGSVNNIYTKKKLIASFNTEENTLIIGDHTIDLTDIQSEKLKGVIQFYYRK